MTKPDVQTGYAPINGLKMYYEIHGQGEPLILIHGGFGTTGMFGALLPGLAQTRQAIAVELQGHGHTADIDRPLRLELLADDIAALIDYLGYQQADIFGYSLGGGVAMQTAFRHPDMVRKLALMSAPYKFEDWYPEVRAAMGHVDIEALNGTIIHQAYLAVAPNPDDWTALAHKTAELLSSPPYDWTEEVRGLQMPTLLIAADADGFPPAHLVEMYGLLGGGLRDAGWDGSGRPASQLAIIPGTTHYDIIARGDMLVPILTSFLDAPMPGAARVGAGMQQEQA